MKPQISPLAMVLLAAAICFGLASYVLVTPHLIQLGKQQVDTTTADGAQAVPKTRTDILKSDAEQASLLLPSSDNQYDLSVQIEGLATVSGATISSLAITPDAAKSVKALGVTANRFVVTVGIAGSYQQVQRFVDGLTTLERFVGIDQVYVSAASATEAQKPSVTSNQSVTSQITAYAYYQP